MTVLHYVTLLGLPSVSSWVLATDIAASRFSGVRFFSSLERRILVAAIAITALVLHLATLGFVPDAYRAGFMPATLVIVALAGIIAGQRSIRLASFVLILLIAFDLHLLPSRNLLDYFVDPVIGLLAMGWCIWRLFVRLRSWFWPTASS